MGPKNNQFHNLGPLKISSEDKNSPWHIGSCDEAINNETIAKMKKPTECTASQKIHIHHLESRICWLQVEKGYLNLLVKQTTWNIDETEKRQTIGMP